MSKSDCSLHPALTTFDDAPLSSDENLNPEFSIADNSPNQVTSISDNHLTADSSSIADDTKIAGWTWPDWFKPPIPGSSPRVIQKTKLKITIAKPDCPRSNPRAICCLQPLQGRKGYDCVPYSYVHWYCWVTSDIHCCYSYEDGVAENCVPPPEKPAARFPLPDVPVPTKPVCWTGKATCCNSQFDWNGNGRGCVDFSASSPACLTATHICCCDKRDGSDAEGCRFPDGWELRQQKA